MTRLTLTVLIALGLVLPGILFADSKWAACPSFGISIDLENRKYPVLTFIPAGTLLFDVDRSACSGQTEEPYTDKTQACTDEITQAYTAITTQDGIRLCILDEYVSDKNTIPAEKFEKWNKDGVDTFTDRPRPELLVIRKKGRYFNLECGDSRRRNDGIQRVYVRNLNKYDEIINDHFGLAHIRKDRTTRNGQPRFNVELRDDYGEDNHSYEYRVYKIKENNPDRDVEKTYAAQIIYECTKTGRAVKLRQISSVVLKQQDDEQKDIWQATLEPWRTPPDLEEFTGTPHYLYSVNNRQQYFALMSRLERFFPNKAEAGYFLAEFNRSCWYSERERKTKSCVTHSYERSEQ